MFLTVKIAEKGNKLERALMDKRRIGTPVTVNGKNFVSITDACREYGVDYEAVRRRKGDTDKTVEEAINDVIANPVQRKTGKLVTVNGQQFSSIADVCKEYGVNYYAVVNKTSGTDKTVEKVINDIIANSVKHGPRTPVTVNGKQFDSIADACRECGADYEAVRRRRRDTDKTVEEAINDVIANPVKRKTGKLVTVNGKQFTSILDACKEYNVSYKAVANKRLGTNKTVEEVINDILANFTKCGPNKLITVNGKQFASIADVCKEYGVNYQTLCKRRARTNKTVEEIVNEMLGLPQTEEMVETASQKSVEPEKRRSLVSLRGVYVIRANRRNRQRKNRRILQAV